MKNTQDPYLVRQLSVFSLRGVTPMKDTEIYPSSSKRRPYVQRGREVCIILHRSACTGANTSVVWSVRVLLRMDEVLCVFIYS